VIARLIRHAVAETVSWIRLNYYRFMGITIGKNCYISSDARIDIRRGKITLGDNVTIAGGSYVLGHTGWRASKEGEETRLEDNVKIYVNAVIFPGVTVGENSCVGAGAIVTGDVPPNVIVMGNPARVIGRSESKKD